MRAGWLWMCAGVALAARAAADAPPAVLSRASVPARGRQEAVLRVAAFGRYAITVASPQGTALQLVDRIAGPGETRGTVGKTDGRLDVFLDRGEYQVVTWAHERGSGDARLAVRGFTERNAPAPPLLVELKPVESTLDDLEQRSYWLDVKERRRVTLEAAGRSLADLRLWTNGDWLVDAEPSREIVSPKPGRAIAVCRLVADLDPGLYLLTAYGGASVPQAEESGEHSFHLRFGVPVLGAVGRGRHTVSPFGTDYWLVPGTATYFRLELPDAVPAQVQVGADATRLGAPLPDASAEATAAITKNSVVPVAELDVARRDAAARRLVTVTGAPGQPYVLQHFDRGTPLPWGGRYWVLPRDGTYWISTVHSGDPADSVDATAIVTRMSRARAAAPHVKPVFAQVVDLADGPWVRRCNLLDAATVFVHVPAAGSYELLARGTEARFRIEPFLVSRPQGYEPPPFRAGGGLWDLEPGYYVLTAEPVKKGILDVALRAAGSEGDAFAALRTGAGAALRAAAQFPTVRVAADTLYTLYLNQQPEVSAGLVARMLPLDLTDPLPVTQRPGERVALHFTTREAGALRAEAEDGTLVAVSVDGAPPVPSQTVTPGEHRLEIHPPAETTINYAIALEPVALQAATPLPPLPDPSRAVPPALPVLTDAAPQYFDLGRHADRTFLVRAEVPALYRLETTGLLATAGRLRTRTVTAFDRASANGVGRNFFLQQFLREGDYQVTVATEGESKGHVGLRLARTELIDGGELSEGGAARRALAAGEAIAYRFTVRETGDYRVRSFGEDRTFRCRLEDDAGWPIEPPNVPADLVRRFAPGTYRVISMPEPVATRRLTLVERIREPEKREGHGPHRLPLATAVQHVWNEPEPGAARVPDSWLFTLPAPADARIHLSGEMQGRLVAQDGNDVAVLPPGRGWTGHLAAGRYRLDATCARPDNRVPYDVGVWPEQLVAGVDREVAAPTSVPVSVGRDGLVQLGSFGSDDVRARLFDADERLVASNDDGFDDWNFQIQTRLAAGSYRLLVEPVGRDAARTHVAMRAPVETVGSPLALPTRTRFRLRDRVDVRPLAVPAGAELLVLAARAPEGVGCALEAAAPDGDFRTIGSAVGRVARVEAPLAPEGRYRLRVWSVDGRKIKVDAAVAAITPPRASVAQLASGVTLARAGGSDPATAAVAVDVDRPGAFRLAEAAGVRVCLAPDTPCAAAPAGIVATPGRIWLVADAPATAAASRVVLASGDAVPVETPAVVDLASAKGGPVVVVASSLADQPGVRIVERGVAAEPDGRGMAVGVRSATAVALAARDPVAAVWAATSTGSLQADARAWRFAPPAPEPAGWGTSAGALDGVAARALDLPAGAKRVRLALGEATVAVLSDADRVASVHAATGSPLDETVETTATRVTVLHTRAATDRYRIELLPLGDAGAAAALAPGVTYERAALEAGTLRLAVTRPERPAVVHVRGAAGDAVLVTDDGRVARGVDLPLTAAGGTLVVPHAPGFVLAWVDRPGEEANDLWGRDTAAAEKRVEPPAIVRLDAAVESLRLVPAEPAMLHLRSATPAVVLLARGDAPPEVSVHGAGVVVDAYVGAEPVRVGLRALGGRALAGTAEVTTSPVTAIREGLGPEVLLPAGATALFSFAVTREGPVGIGVRATPDIVGCTLLDARGATLGTGVVQMPTLKPGTYLLALHAPAESGPVAARPALAGIELPGTGPPADVVREYMQQAAR